MKRCPHCSQAIQDDAAICPYCRNNPAAAVPLPPPAFPGMPASPQAASPAFPGDAYPMHAAETSGKATASLVLGIASYIILPFFGPIGAVILGHISLSDIKKSAGRLKGRGMAIAGLVLGYLWFATIPIILIIAAIAIPNLIKAKMAANEAAAVGSLRMITTAEIGYTSSCPQIGFAASLQELGPGGTSCPANESKINPALALGFRSGYRFTPHTGSFTGQAPEGGFGWNADPVSEASGRRHFFVDQTGVIRFSTDGPADQDSTALQ